MNANCTETLVSVYITTHNRGVKLKRAIDSVLNQTYQNIEIIVSDDGSSDGTKELMEQLVKQYSNLRFIRSDVPKGANHARNLAIKRAKGEFITGLDDDDEFLECRVQRFVESWDDHYAFLCDNFLEISEDGSCSQFYKSDQPKVITLKQLLLENICSNQIFTKLEYLRSIGGFDESLKKYQDWDCWIRLSNKMGNGLRLSNKSYIMYHDQLVRVSNNQSHQIALMALMKSNKSVYLDTFSASFVDYLFKKSDFRFDTIGMLSCRNFHELKFALRKSCILSWIKRKIKGLV
ncbi:glycosyltransferase family 2 protein [Vibrio algivorus]|uniref:Glycosyl transferase family 2 n=1 Tax=Vibrio algivorus TaxID=1667024 RepID=A0ABQ6EJM8_9VIBR|nr:glycosyltransferase family 2 protein [Vibrio algivorus]GLT13176.1 glycosyl transferase family 2 [Vibrio algivorus]